MTDIFSVERRSQIMSRIRGTGTKPEMTVRRLVHAMGYRYRLHRSDLPGKPDLVFAKRRKIIFVHGCFWHQHDDPNCKLASIPKSNQEYWLPKLRKNTQRDAHACAQLAEAGWRVLVIWECQLKDKEALIESIESFLERRTDTATAPNTAAQS